MTKDSASNFARAFDSLDHGVSHHNEAVASTERDANLASAFRNMGDVELDILEAAIASERARRNPA